MTRTGSWIVMLCLASGWVLTGCDQPPAPPRTADGRSVKSVQIADPTSPEGQAAAALETARVNYKYRLTVLAGYYNRIGNANKLVWTQRELKNLDTAHTFSWTGIGEVLPPEGESVENADERILAEFAVGARKQYLQALDNLIDLYERTDNTFRHRLAKNVKDRFDPVHTYMYFMQAEVPPADLKPIEVIPEANQLYDKAYDLYRSGKILPAVVDYKKEREALLLFKELVRKYPQSDKIALSAYYIGEILKEYFDEDLRAVQWYERAWQWDPNITKPARFQAATVYDYRLQDKAKAVEMYRAAIQHEQFNQSNVGFAHGRIRDLTR